MGLIYFCSLLLKVKSTVMNYMRSHRANATEFKLKLSDLSLSTSEKLGKKRTEFQ